MNEADWVERIAAELKGQQWLEQDGLALRTGLKIAYGCEIRSYGPQPETQIISFETDLAIIETAEGGRWKPRVVVEAKLGSVTTHDAITYSQKAVSHRAVHPYLRYGIMLGNRKHYPLPGRLYRHGAHFDFMISFRGVESVEFETAMFVELLKGEVAASRTLEKVLYESRRKGRAHYILLHRQLQVKCAQPAMDGPGGAASCDPPSAFPCSSSPSPE